jgi:hypothetical protein
MKQQHQFTMNFSSWLAFTGLARRGISIRSARPFCARQGGLPDDEKAEDGCEPPGDESPSDSILGARFSEMKGDSNYVVR